ncbi:CPBP family intramembrane glutamic endopeptidase [Agromyces sp. LHK192]|uniref:CPBP family intramembrane glutamic endopeptidase n=1 Tax=Agromyces sp. LHK192 TaxID=2498704 RepID=UPI00196B58DF|nr:type II CAAX endopeptidase family protein [Agromyces sp. LHK192]
MTNEAMSTPPPTPSPVAATVHAAMPPAPPSAADRRRARADAQQRKNTERGPILPERVPWVAVAVFLVIAFGLGWLVCLPLWLSGEGLMHPAFSLIALALMFTPTVATLAVVFLVRRPPNAPRLLGLSPIRPAGRTWFFIALAFVLFSALPLLAMLLGQAMGLIRLDFAGLSGAQAILEAAGGPPVDASLVVWLGVATLPFATLISCFAAFGEELGWRGWLQPALRPLGIVPALLITGVIWGLWHAPIILLGYNYQRTDLVGVLCMVAFCVLAGFVIGWMRLRSASVWPAVVAHGAVNTATSQYLFFVDASELPVGPWGSVLGWPGWILLAVCIVVIVVTGQLRKEAQPGLTLAEAREREIR